MVAQTDREDHLEFHKLLQTAEDYVNATGRNINQRLVNLFWTDRYWYRHINTSCRLTGCPHSWCWGYRAVDPPTSSADAAPLPADDSVPPPGWRRAAAVFNKVQNSQRHSYREARNRCAFHTRDTWDITCYSPPTHLPLEHACLSDISEPSQLLHGCIGRAACEQCGHGPGTSPLHQNKKKMQYLIPTIIISPVVNKNTNAFFQLFKPPICRFSAI